MQESASSISKINETIRELGHDTDSAYLSDPCWPLSLACLILLGFDPVHGCKNHLEDFWKWRTTSTPTWPELHIGPLYKLAYVAAYNNDFNVPNIKNAEDERQWAIEPYSFISWAEKQGIHVRPQLAKRFLYGSSQQHSTKEAPRTKPNKVQPVLDHYNCRLQAGNICETWEEEIKYLLNWARAENLPAVKRATLIKSLTKTLFNSGEIIKHTEKRFS